MRSLDRLRCKLRALLGDSDACHYLGARYATGDDGEWPKQDLRAAVRWYRLGADRGDAGCQYDLGFMVLLGEGTPRDHRAGVRLLEQAASQGFCEAIRLLADVFASGGYGVPADPAEAERWSRRLAEHLAAHPEDKRLYER